MAISSQSAAKPRKASVGKTANARGHVGRPAAKTFINVQVKMSTRKALNQLKSLTGLKTQGDVLDRLIADVMHSRQK